MRACTCDGGGSITHDHSDITCTGGHSPDCFDDLHAAHYYPNLDQDFNPVPSKNPVDDLACYHRDGPVPWLECHDERVAKQALLDVADHLSYTQCPTWVVDYLLAAGK
jgi:hypothetical protein